MNSRQAFDASLLELMDAIIHMGRLSTNALDLALKALQTGDGALAKQVIEDDQTIDELEREIEQDCLRLLLRQQPVAGDLRKISTAIKMITDIERIADAAVDIAEISLFLPTGIFPEIADDLTAMANAARNMASDAISAYVHEDEVLAQKVCQADDVVDDLFMKIRAVLGEKMRGDTSIMGAVMDHLMIIKYLERIGDHAENISEWVIFYKTGIRKKD